MTFEFEKQQFLIKSFTDFAFQSRRSNALQTIDNEMSQLIYCLNYIRRD